MPDDINDKRESEYSRFMPPMYRNENTDTPTHEMNISVEDTHGDTTEIDNLETSVPQKNMPTLEEQEDITILNQALEEAHNAEGSTSSSLHQSTYSSGPYQHYENHIPGYNPNPQYQPAPNAMALAGFVLSLIGLFLIWLPIVGVLCWLLGLIFVCIGLTRQKNNLAIAGLCVSALTLLIMIGLFLSLSKYF